MLESLRNFLTGPRLFIVIAACALPFVFLGTSSLTTAFAGSLGTINGENVSEADFQVASNLTIQRFKSVYGEEFDFNVLDEETQIEQIKQELTVQKVLLSKARSLGFINNNTKKDAKVAIIKTPSFQIDGMFDEGVYEAQVNSNGHTKDSYIDVMTDLMASELYRNSIAALNFSTDEEIIEIASLLEQTVNLDFIKIDSDKLKNSIVNTEAELQEFYQSNQIMFYSDELRSFEYFLLTPDSYKDKVNVPEGFVEDSYADYLSKANERTQIRIAHIMVDKANYESSEKAFNVIKGIETRLKEGSEFSKLAAELSEDFVSKENGGDLEYFSSDIFPEEFGEALKGLALNDISSVVELEQSLHILKVTEYSEAEILTMEQMKSQIVEELVNSESLALMNDDYDVLDQMVVSGDSITTIGESLTQDILSSEQFSFNNFSFIEKDPKIKEYIFSPDSEIGQSYAIDLEDSILVVALKDIDEAALKVFSDVKENVSSSLSEFKAIEKQNLLSAQIDIAKSEDNLDAFISAYSFISKDAFVEVKRYSSLMPQEVLTEVFKFSSGDEISVNSRNGDSYIINLLSINKPSEESVLKLLEQYESFSDQRLSNRMSEIINDDIFKTARVNLNNAVF